MNQIDTCSPVAPHSSVKLGFVGRYLAGFILQRPTRKRNKLEVEIHPETGQRSFDHFPLNGWMVECNTHPVISLVIEASAPKDFDAILSSVAAWKWCCWIRTPDGPISSKQGGGWKWINLRKLNKSTEDGYWRVTKRRGYLWERCESTSSDWMSVWWWLATDRTGWSEPVRFSLGAYSRRKRTESGSDCLHKAIRRSQQQP